MPLTRPPFSFLARTLNRKAGKACQGKGNFEMTTTNLDQISAEITQLMVDTLKNEAALQPLVLKIWTAFDDAKEKRIQISIEGATNKTAWTKLTGKPKMRYCQYLVRDGSRKRGTNDDTHSVRVTVNLDKATHVILDGVRREIADKKVNGHLVEITFIAEAAAPVPAAKAPRKKKEDKKPVKHAKHDYHSTWCGMRTSHSTKLAAKNHATCPYCVAAIAANVEVAHPIAIRRKIEDALKEARSNVTRFEKQIATCDPKYHETSPMYKSSVRNLPRYQDKVAELEAKLAAIKLVTTPELAVEYAKKRIADRTALREANEMQLVHIQSPMVGKNQTETTLCGGTIIHDEGNNLYTQIANGSRRPATCPGCIEAAKDITKPALTQAVAGDQPTLTLLITDECPTQ
jgi:hypothetical protein